MVGFIIKKFVTMHGHMNVKKQIRRIVGHWAPLWTAGPTATLYRLLPPSLRLSILYLLQSEETFSYIKKKYVLSCLCFIFSFITGTDRLLLYRLAHGPEKRGVGARIGTRAKISFSSRSSNRNAAHSNVQFIDFRHSKQPHRLIALHTFITI